METSAKEVAEAACEDACPGNVQQSCTAEASGMQGNSFHGDANQGSPRVGTTRLLIIRHGETVWNAEKRMQGQLDVKLNDVGRGQARRVAETLQKLGISDKVDAVISSDLARASETADIVATACPGAQRHVDADLREINFGDLQGNLAADVGSRKDEVMTAWAQGDMSRAFPGGESAEAVVVRGLRGLRSAATAGECVVVVSHGSILRWCAICIELGKQGLAPHADSMALPPVASLMKASVRNCCCSHLLYDHEAQRFHSNGWFEVLDATGMARDDTG